MIAAADRGMLCSARCCWMSWYLMAQSISRAMASRFPASIASSARSHSPRTRVLTASAPRLLVKSFALARYSRWMSSALIWRPSACRSGCPGYVAADLAAGADRVVQGQVRQHGARLGHAQHEIGGARPQQRGGLAHGGVADAHAQPPDPGGGARLVAGTDERPGPGGRGRQAVPGSPGPSAEAEQAPRGVWTTAPAPQMSCLVTRNGIRMSASLPNLPRRPTR